MNFDMPKPPKPWENKKSVAFAKWLNKQINLTPEKWSPEFWEYIKIKSGESEEKKESQELSAEEKREKTFKRYSDSLKLTESDLKEKSILDLGCGDGEFVVSCMKKGLTREVYGIDSNLEGDSSNKDYHNNFFSKDFTDDFPVKNLDYVVSVGAISLYLHDERKINAEVMISKALDAIKEGGEIRIWPIKKALRGTEIEGIKEEEQVTAEILDNLDRKFNIAWELKPTDINVNGKDKDVWAEQVLIIKHKK